MYNKGGMLDTKHIPQEPAASHKRSSTKHQRNKHPFQKNTVVETPFDEKDAKLEDRENMSQTFYFRWM